MDAADKPRCVGCVILACGFGGSGTAILIRGLRVIVLWGGVFSGPLLTQCPPYIPRRVRGIYA